MEVEQSSLESNILIPELKLFSHQYKGVETMEKWLREGHGGIMADEMGLGKTCQVYLLLLNEKGTHFRR